MKKVLTGFSDNIFSNKSKIKVWANSLRRYSDAHITLIAANATEQDLQVCKELNIDVYCVTESDKWFINHKRLIHTKKFIEQSDGDLFLVTDVFDVVFQADPFAKLDLTNYDLFTSGEGININQEPWNADVIKKVFPQELQACWTNEIICSGIIAGKKQQMVDLYNRMFEMCENSLNGHNIKDQAALIILIVKNQLKRLKIFTVDDGWAMHCQSAGPTQFFESWGLRNSLSQRYGVPVAKNGQIFTADDKLYDMVHQFNRIPEWNLFLTQQYV
jgi:hypothetical protein